MIYNSLGKANIAFIISILVNVVLIISFTIGVNFGVQGMAYSYLIAYILLFYPVYNTAIKQLNIKLIEVFKTIKGSVFASIIMGLAVLLINKVFQFSLLEGLLVKVTIGSLVYAFTIYYFEQDLIKLVIRKLMKIKR
jgi:PST family polysaccharide transporter